MFRSLHTPSPVVQITVNIQIIKGLLQCYSIVKKRSFGNFHGNKYKYNEYNN